MLDEQSRGVHLHDHTFFCLLFLAVVMPFLTAIASNKKKQQKIKWKNKIRLSFLVLRLTTQIYHLLSQSLHTDSASLASRSLQSLLE